MAEQPPRQDIEELVRRLESGPFPLEDIREAGQILVSVQAHPISYGMALEFWESTHAQVRILGMSMMEALAPHLEGARGFVAGARDAAARLATEGRPNVPDYSAIGEVIKMWMRESRQGKNRR